MQCVFRLLSAAILIAALLPSVSTQNYNEAAAQAFIVEYAEQKSEIDTLGSELAWAYYTNITEHNGDRLLDYTEKEEKPFYSGAADNASLFEWNSFQNETLKKIFGLIALKGHSGLSTDKFREVFYNMINKILQDMDTVYSTGKVCKNGKNPFSLEPELTELLDTSHDYDDLLWAWKNWRDATGMKMRKDYQRFVVLSNEAAVADGFVDTGAYWRSGYEVPGYDFQADLEKLYDELKPLYNEVHKFIRYKLIEVYGADKFPSTGHIPAHLLGNMWAQTWTNVESLVKPFDDGPAVNATPALQNMTVIEIFEKADHFFESLGLESLPAEFWERSMLEKPDGREVVCHASAWDFSNGTDFRIKQCTRKTMADFVTVHHEMGHIQYYLQYKDQYIDFRRGANPGFHEAVGDVLALSVATPKHLKKVELINSYSISNESDINFLLSMALDKIVFLPFAKLMDDYRWGIFNGSISTEEYTAEWWKLRCKYQGVSPPVQRDETDFDAGAKYHIPGNTPYVRYFVSFVLQFQFHKALCQAASQTGPLHTCDIYQSQAAGQKLGDMLKLGMSGNWPDALEAMTGTRNMSLGPLIEYFQPLIDWLKDENEKNGQANMQWTDACPTDLPAKDTVPSGVCDGGTAEPNTAQPNTAQPNTAQPNTNSGSVVFTSLPVFLAVYLFSLYI